MQPSRGYEASASVPPTAPRTGGRPPDLEAAARILPAALEVYGERGWHGYNLHQVALRARVGKSLIYSRWRSADELLVDAFKQLVEPPTPNFGLDLRSLLISEGLARLLSYTGSYGPAIMRLSGEARSTGDPQLAIVHERIYRGPSTQLVGDLRRRRARGEFSTETSVTTLLDAVEGALYMHTILTPPDRIEALRARSEQFVTGLIDQLLGGIGYRSSQTSVPPSPRGGSTRH